MKSSKLFNILVCSNTSLTGIDWPRASIYKQNILYIKQLAIHHRLIQKYIKKTRQMNGMFMDIDGFPNVQAPTFLG